jgi:hypothetical protein
MVSMVLPPTGKCTYLTRASQITGSSTSAMPSPTCDQIDYAEVGSRMAVRMIGREADKTQCVSESKARLSRREPLDDHFIYSIPLLWRTQE